MLGVDCCLVEVKESARVRSNEWVKSEADGIVLFADPPPMRVDCIYLVSAWDSASISESLEPGRAEHQLLYEVLACLAAASRSTPRASRPGDSAVWRTMPEAIKEVDLPTRVAPAEGYSRLGEFWTIDGHEHPLAPGDRARRHVAGAPPHEITGPPVHTEPVAYGLMGPIDETRMTIGVEMLHHDDHHSPAPGTRARRARAPEVASLRIREGIPTTTAASS